VLSNTQVNGCIFSNNVTGGADIDNVRMLNSQLSSNDDYGLTSEFSSVMNCYFSQNSAQGIYNPKRTSIIANIFNNNSPSSYEGQIAIFRDLNKIAFNIMSCNTPYGVYIHNGSGITENEIITNIIQNETSEKIYFNQDDYNRNLVNGVGWNAGNPATTGDWNGFAEYAARKKATVIDVSGTSPLPRYEAQKDGAGGHEWVDVSVTAA